jgi:tRNA(Arg) A34 adenosine deaminase TadA
MLRRAIAAAARARAAGNHPFGAVLVAANGELLLEGENTVLTERDCTGHAELNLVRQASRRFDRTVLATCTLVSSTEPCAMCAGAIFWSGIPRVVFGLEGRRLREFAAPGSAASFLGINSREVFRGASHSVTVVGPLLEEEASAVHRGFWTAGVS